MFLRIRQWAQVLDRHLSLQKKLLGVVFGLVISGTAMTLLAYSTMNSMQEAQNDFIQIAELQADLKDLGLSIYKMASRTVNFIGEPTEARWKEKEEADEILSKSFVKINERVSNPDLKPLLIELSQYDENYFNPLDLTLKQARTTSDTDYVLKVYGVEYIPLLQRIEEMLSKAQELVAKDLQNMRQANQAKAQRGILVILVVILCGVLLSVFLLRLSGKFIVNGLATAMRRLKKETEATDAAAKSISDSSRKLAEAAIEQASSLQETAASIEEMSSMIHRSAENANQSRRAGEASAAVAAEGKEAAQEMLASVTEIESGNQEIMAAMEQSNHRITEIARVIAAIAEKTRVINDIVFQTKLLSFNASVEAARAGDHGKGFAVVAEEVGNLAQMSGNAALDINNILDASIRKVETIIAETSSAVGQHVNKNREKVQQGTRIAHRSGTMLDSIVSEVQKVNAMVGDISVAMKEQSAGVGEITKAMGQLDQVTQQNTALSQQIAHAADGLADQARSLHAVFTSVERIIWGAKSTSQSDNNELPIALSEKYNTQGEAI